MPTVTGRATDFITFSRPGATGGGATVTDSDGKIKWAAHNLLLASEQFDAASWSRQGLSGVTANAIAAPNGTSTADKLLENNLNDFHYVTQLNVIDDSAPVSTLSVFAKAAERQYLNLALAWGANFVAATFDLTGGTVTSNRSGGTGASQSSSITSVGGDWYLCTLRGTIGTGGSDAAIIAISNSATPTGTYPQYTGTTGNGFHVWGAHLYRSDLGGMQANASAYPMYNPTTPKNLLGYTESFNNAAWTKTNVTVTTGIIAPNGLSNAATIAATANGGEIYQGITFPVGTTRTTSVWIRRRTGTGTIKMYGATASTDITSQVTADWTRVSITSSAGSSLIYFGINLGTSGDAVDIWGAQLSDSASLDAYSPVYGAAVTSAAYYAPRLDYSGSSLAALGLLVEEQRTNLLTYSNELNNAAWAPTSVTVTANALVSPDGTSSAETVAGTASITSYLVSPTATVATSTTYNISIYVKYQSSLLSRIRVFDSGLGTELAGVVFAWSAGVPSTSTTSGTWVTAPTYTSVGNGWYRLSGAFSSGAFTGLKVLFYPDQSALGTSTAVWGAQLEAGSFATSYIPTGASTATRTTDVASVSTQAFPYSSTAGTVVASFDMIGGTAANANNQIIVAFRQDSQNRILMYNGDSVASLYVVTGNVEQAYIMRSSVSANTVAKFGSAFTANDFAAVLNGGAAGTDTSGSLPVPTIMGIGNDNNSAQLNGHIRQITYIPRRLSSSDLQARTL